MIKDGAIRTAGGTDLDVAIVGYGPVGQALAALLGRAGHRVAAFERYGEIYRLPRAVHLDHEIMRLLQTLDLADVLADEMVPLTEYRWFGADAAPLLHFELPRPGPSGWEPGYLFFQPELERAIDEHACVPAGVTVERGWVAVHVRQHAHGVELTLRRAGEDEPERLALTGETRRVTARFLIGADGANSFVRGACGIAQRDLGFQERWLVIDAEPHDMGKLAHLPVASQWCDPARPHTLVQSGPRHRRWEFMLLPHEGAEDFADPERVWELLAPWYAPGDGPLTRSAVYEFRSMLAERMRHGRVLIAGDAAHLTPPFLGQGLCTGLRDAANIAWKLDLVLRGLAPDALLDTIELERQPQNEAIIRLAADLGRVLCELDPEAAAQRDAMVRSADPPPPPVLAALDGGVMQREGDVLAGTLSVQGRVLAGGRRGRFDDIVGRGFQLIVASGDPYEYLRAEHRRLLDRLRVAVASLSGVHDLDERLSAWLAEHTAHAVLVRPDFYVFGSASNPAALPQLLDDFATQLTHDPAPRSKGALV